MLRVVYGSSEQQGVVLTSLGDRADDALAGRSGHSRRDDRLHVEGVGDEENL